MPTNQQDNFEEKLGELRKKIKDILPPGNDLNILKIVLDTQTILHQVSTQSYNQGVSDSIETIKKESIKKHYSNSTPFENGWNDRGDKDIESLTNLKK